VAAIAAGYAGLSLVQRGQVSGSAPVLLIAAAAVWAIGVLLDRTASWRPVAAVTMVLIPLMFVPFVRDYFDGYRPRASEWFGGNIRGAMEELVRLDGEAPAPEIRLGTDVPYVRSYWRFYLTMWDRTDLLSKTREFDLRSLDGLSLPANTYLLSTGNALGPAALAGDAAIVRVAGAGDPGVNPEQFTIYRVLASR